MTEEVEIPSPIQVDEDGHILVVELPQDPPGDPEE